MVPVLISAGLPQSALAIEQLAAFRRLHASARYWDGRPEDQRPTHL